MPRAVVFLSAFALWSSLTLAQSGQPTIAGDWVGAYQVYPKIVRMQLRVDAAGTHGELRLEPLSGEANGQPRGIVPVDIQFSAGTRTLRISAAADAYRQAGTPRIPGFTGVLAPSGVFGGTLRDGRTDASPYFVLARPDVADTQFLKQLRDVSGHSRNPLRTLSKMYGLDRVPTVFASGASDRTLREWAGRLLTEYPDVDPHRTELGALFLAARQLFRDDHFAKYFGKPYDQIGAASLEKVAWDIRKLPAPQSNFPEERANGAARAMEPAFVKMTGTFNAADVILSIVALRPIVEWRDAALKQLATADPVVGQLAVIQEMENTVAEVMHTLWPSEREAFATALSNTRSQIAGPLLKAHVDTILTETPAVESARRIASAFEVLRQPSHTPPAPAARWTSRSLPGSRPLTPGSTATNAASFETIATLVSLEVREQERQRLHSGLMTVLATLADQERPGIHSLGTGIEGLEAGVRWHVSFIDKYGALAESQAFSALLQELATKRAAQLPAAEKALTARLQKAASTREISELIHRTISVPSDRRDAAGARILAAAEKPKAALLAKETAQAAAASKQAKEAASACAQVSNDPGELPGEPTAQDMCRALEATMRAPDETFRDLKGACNSPAAKNDPATAMSCLIGGLMTFGGGAQISVQGFSKVACVSGAAAGRPGFFCDYAVQVQTGNSMLSGLVTRLPGSVSNARFVKTPAGWVMFPSK